MRSEKECQAVCLSIFVESRYEFIFYKYKENSLILFLATKMFIFWGVSLSSKAELSQKLEE